jgi:long-subunit fatty acid transport protein
MTKSPGRITASAALLSIAISPAQAWAFGLESPVPFGGRYAGSANAAASSVSGAPSLYFNPAGLGGIKGTEINLSLAPNLISMSGPFNLPAANTLSATAVTPGGGIFASHAVTDKLGLGAGVYFPAANGSSLGTVDLSALGASFRPELSGAIYALELSLGAGYQVTPEISLGAAWRASSVRGALKTLSADGAPSTWSELEISGLSGTNFTGFRVGGQYRATDESWGAGIVFRNSVPWELKGGTTSAKLLSSGATVPGGTDATETTELPWQLGLGADYLVLPQWRLLLQYEFTHYAANREILLTGTLGGTAFSQAAPLAWNNMHALRVGSELDLIQNWPLRFGLAYNSKMVPTDKATVARAEPPAAMYTLTAGTGTSFGEHWRTDLGVSLHYSKGTAAGTEGGVGDGEMKFFVTTFHLGASYAF